jgi:hypothetical protein
MTKSTHRKKISPKNVRTLVQNIVQKRACVIDTFIYHYQLILYEFHYKLSLNFLS